MKWTAYFDSNNSSSNNYNNNRPEDDRNGMTQTSIITIT